MFVVGGGVVALGKRASLNCPVCALRQTGNASKVYPYILPFAGTGSWPPPVVSPVTADPLYLPVLLLLQLLLGFLQLPLDLLNMLVHLTDGGMKNLPHVEPVTVKTRQPPTTDNASLRRQGGSESRLTW